MPSSEKPIQLGLCCLNTVLRAENPVIVQEQLFNVL